MTALALALSYALGSVPTGLWLGLRLRGVDIRAHGSKNIGATNTLRVLGKGLGAIALAGDVGKGAASVLLVAQLSEWEYMPLACGLAAIAGHTWSLFLKFRGGKGVATSAGVFLGLAPIPALIGIGAFILSVLTTRMVSIGSIAAAIALAIAVFFFHDDNLLRGITVAVALLVVVRHRSNIGRIVRGEESRIWGGGKESNTDSASEDDPSMSPDEKHN